MNLQELCNDIPTFCLTLNQSHHSYEISTADWLKNCVYNGTTEGNKIVQAY